MIQSQDLAITRVLKAIDAVKAGGMVIMVDDEDRENEGDLVLAAQFVQADKINFMTKEARGLICLSLDQTYIEQLQLPMMEDASKRGNGKGTAFTVSIEARTGVTTGISAADRAHTIAVAVADGAKAEDIVVPGHVFPLKARAGGVLERAGHTEGSIDLARLAGLKPAAVICEIMNDDGSMARMPDLEKFAERHAIPIVTIADLIAFKLMKDSLIKERQVTEINTSYGRFKAVLFDSLMDGMQHLALVKGEALGDHIVDVRVHRQKPLLDVFAGRDEQGFLGYGLKMLQKSEAAVLIYLLQQPSAGFLEAEVQRLAGGRSKVIEDARHSSIAADSRMLGIGAQILRHLGVRRMRVHMINPKPLRGLQGYDLELCDTVDISKL